MRQEDAFVCVDNPSQNRASFQRPFKPLKKLQFNTGPQVGMFRQGGDGQAAIQGAEIPGKFFSGRRSQVEDVQAFKRLIGKLIETDDLAARIAALEAKNGKS